ncbi:SAM-dependent methyltransferase [Streptomyces liliifuscus]|uniref:Class I SAM-dependent methyltransferase n=2 Tax=Streptomyces TaxID=1883 RepID=A0A7T7L4E7_9ACTN|nr:class I SAM-dependent methyltransferase [Streptomyces liliifuscus]QQM46267.1 class I SAM-dependent methyltransferase [Streptomyces liliifuscus]
MGMTRDRFARLLATGRILNPFTEDQLMQLGEICRLREGQRQFDLACGKGEMAARWAAHFGISGLGVDNNEEFIADARARAAELGVSERVRFEVADAGRVPAEPVYDVVSCIGASWIAGGVSGMVKTLRPALRPHGLMLLGEPYWKEPPPEEAYEALGCEPDEFTSLVGTMDRFESAGMQLVEMALADEHSWDRYIAAQWWTLSEWLRAHPHDEDAPLVRRFLDNARRGHLAHGRRHLGWGVFVLREA